MKPQMPYKANDFAKHFSPPAPPIIPPLENHKQQPSDGNSNRLLYLGFALLLIVIAVGGIYLVNQNEQIMKQITRLNDAGERTMPGIASSTSQTSEPIVKEDTPTNKTST